MRPVPVDTNVLVRLATGDSPAEHAAAEALLAAGPILILPTVLLEAEWVLRSIYAYSPTQYLAFAEWLSESQNVQLEQPDTIREALRLHGLGFDFADALHLAAADGQPLATFDKALIRRAKRQDIPVRALPGP
jgi:predicted nucleic acid-binding protein